MDALVEQLERSGESYELIDCNPAHVDTDGTPAPPVGTEIT